MTESGPAPQPAAPPPALRRLIVGTTMLALILAFVWPMPLHLTSELVSKGSNDLWQQLWNFNWMRTALLVQHESPYHTTDIFYPSGVPLVYHSLNPFTAAVSIPMQVLFGVVAAFNLMLIANLTAAGLATYWLGRILGLDALPAWAAGALFACNPSLGTAVNNGHADLLSIYWLPLGVALVVRGGGLRSLGLPPGPRLALIAAGLVLAGSTVAIWYWTIMLLLFIGLYGLVEGWGAWRAGGWRALAAVAQRLALVLGVAALVFSPLLALLVQEQLRSPDSLLIDRTPTRDEVTQTGSQDLLTFFLPLPAWPDVIGAGLQGRTFGLGWIVLALSGVAVALARGARRTGLALWLVIAAVCLVLALGPALIVNGQVTAITLPYDAILNLPGAAAMRAPIRFTMLLSLCLAVLAATGLALLLQRCRTARLRALVAALLLVPALVEFFPVPRSLVAATVPDFFQELAAQPSPCAGRIAPPLADCGAVLELPDAERVHKAMFHQTVHGHPMIGGSISRHYTYRFTVDTPGVVQLVRNNPAGLTGDDILPLSPLETAQRALDFYGVRYIVVYPSADPAVTAGLQQTLSLLFPAGGKAYPDYTVYTTPRLPGDRPFLYLGAGWYEQERNADGLHWRWTDQQATATILVPPAAAGAMTLHLEVFALTTPRTLVARVDGQEIGRSPVAGAPGGPLAFPLTLAAGEHQLELASVEPAVSPPGDRRPLSLGYRQLTLDRGP